MDRQIEIYENLIKHYEILIKTLKPKPEEEGEIGKYKALLEKYNKMLFEEEKVLPEEKQIILTNTKKKFYIKRKKQEDIKK